MKRKERNAWRVAEETAERISGAGHQSQLTSNEDACFFLNTVSLNKYQQSSASARPTGPRYHFTKKLETYDEALVHTGYSVLRQYSQQSPWLPSVHDSLGNSKYNHLAGPKVPPSPPPPPGLDRVKPSCHMITHDRRIAENTATNRQRLYGNNFQRSDDR